MPYAAHVPTRQAYGHQIFPGRDPEDVQKDIADQARKVLAIVTTQEVALKESVPPTDLVALSGFY